MNFIAFVYGVDGSMKRVELEAQDIEDAAQRAALSTVIVLSSQPTHRWEWCVAPETVRHPFKQASLAKREIRRYGEIGLMGMGKIAFEGWTRAWMWMAVWPATIIEPKLSGGPGE